MTTIESRTDGAVTAAEPTGETESPWMRRLPWVSGPIMLLALLGDLAVHRLRRRGLGVHPPRAGRRRGRARPAARRRRHLGPHRRHAAGGDRRVRHRPAGGRGRRRGARPRRLAAAGGAAGAGRPAGRAEGRLRADLRHLVRLRADLEDRHGRPPRVLPDHAQRDARACARSTAVTGTSCAGSAPDAGRRSGTWSCRATLPYIFAGAEVAIVFSVIGAIVGEYLGGSEGLGYLVVSSLNALDAPRLFAVIVLLAVLGLACSTSRSRR